MGLLGCEIPIVAAPMAGGATTVALVRAAQEAGAFGFLAAGYKSVETVAEEMVQLRGTAYGVNLFLPGDPPVDRAAFAAYRRELEPEAERYGVELAAIIREDDDGWRDKLDLLLADPVPVVSVTFGVPRAADIAALQKAGTRVLITVTTAAEALAARDAGADALVVQGSEAGGHSGTHDPTRPIAPRPAEAVVREVIAAAGLPVVAGGGVDGPQRARRILDAGAEAVTVGTLLLRTDESGASQTHRDALADPRFTGTVLTHAFTGRPARGLRNAFIDAHEATAPYGYPALHHLTRGLRQAATKAGDPDRVHLWAGTGFRNAPTGPAADVLRHLAG